MPSRAAELLEQLRIARVLMMTVVTGTTAFGFGAPTGRILIAVLLAGAGALALLLGWTPLACAALIVVVGLGTGILDGPVARAVSLGTLQGLYALLGGLAAGPLGPGIAFTALFLLLAMTGGRVLGDVRDMPVDERAGTRTIPLRFGIRASIVFLFCFETLAYLAGAAMYRPGGMGRGWPWCLIAIAAAGTTINVTFAARPTPRRADLANRMSLGLLVRPVLPRHGARAPRLTVKRLPAYYIPHGGGPLPFMIEEFGG